MSVDAAVGVRAARAYRVSAGADPGAAVFHLQGDLAAASAGTLRRELAGAVGRPAVLLDMTVADGGSRPNGHSVPALLPHGDVSEPSP